MQVLHGYLLHRRLLCGGLGWGDDAGVGLCEALRGAHLHGGLRRLKELHLSRNTLGDAKSRGKHAEVKAIGAQLGKSISTG